MSKNKSKKKQSKGIKSNVNFIRKDNLERLRPEEPKARAGIEMTGVEGGGVPDPMLIHRLFNENKRGLKPNRKNRTFREALAIIDKMYLEQYDAPTAITSQIKDSGARGRTNKVVFMNHQFAYEIQKQKGNKQCFDLQNAIQRS